MLRVALLLCLITLGGIAVPQIKATDPPQKIAFEPMRPNGESSESEFWEEVFPSAVVSPIAQNNVVKLRIIIPKSAVGPAPVVVLLHYWGASDNKIEDELAAHLASLGIASVEMPLPYHLSRTPPGHRSGDMTIQADTESIKTTLSQSISDVMRTVDFIQSRPEFDKNQIGLAGTSLGAIVAASAFGVEHRFHSGVFMLGGADLAGIIWSSSITTRIRREFENQGRTVQSVRDAIAPIDPMNLNSPADKRRTLVISARFDNVVPPPNTDLLVSRLGNSQRMIFDAGHYGGFLVQSKIGTAMAHFFEADFGGTATTLPPTIDVPTVRVGLLADPQRGFQIAGGIDIWRANRYRDGFATLLFAPKGFLVFAGADVGGGVALGATLAPRQATLGVFWSVVF